MTTMQRAGELTPEQTLEVLRSRILVDGFHIVLDLQASEGSYAYDALSAQRFLDFYAFFASLPVTFNHPRMREPEFQGRLLTAATTKVANSDVYTRYYAEFVRTLGDVAGLEGLEHFFFVDGGALAVENALKAAFDWKVRKNLAAGRGEMGHRIVHFRHAFHGRSGYTLSLTNTDPVKTMYFPKFDWPRIDHPAIDFNLPEPQRTQDAAAREQEALRQIHEAIAQHPHDVAAIIIETIQGEGGDNHVRGEFLRELRRLCDEHELLLIFDEVQCGMGITGRMWACEHFGVMPDILCFGKKSQVCGIMASERLDEIDGVFKVPSRINSTWGGNLTDMVRATQYLNIIRDENLLDNAAEMGARLLDSLHRLAESQPVVSAVRGRGLMCAFDLPDARMRNALRQILWDMQMLVLVCGERSIRFRPVLDVSAEDIDRGLETLAAGLDRLEREADASGSPGATE